MHQALYRKYRPATFDDVCGQKHITDVLSFEAREGSLSHAYLFCGSRGTGKTSCAKILAKAVNCENPVNGSPCLKCAACMDIASGRATDVIEMDAASHTGVDDIRRILDEVQYTPAYLKKKVYIIDEVHMLSTQAFNALLKTIEEPPEHVLFILATTELHKVPTTIVSRCQRFEFHRIDNRVIASRLKYIAEKENIVLENDGALLIARQAHGGMRDAIGLFELCSSGGADVTAEKVRFTLGLSGYERVASVMDCISKADMESLFRIVSDVTYSGKDIYVFLGELTEFVRDMLVAKYSENASEYLDLTSDEEALLTEASKKFSLSQLVYTAKILDDASVRAMRSPQTKRIITEMALLRLCHPELDTSCEALGARISKLEDALTLGDFPVSAPAKQNSGNYAEVPGAKPAAEAENAASPANTAPPSQEEFTKISDISEVIEKLDGSDRAIGGFLMSCEVYVSADKKKIKLYCDAFTKSMISQGNHLEAVKSAFALARISSGKAEIITENKKIRSTKSPADDLGSLL